MAALHSFSFLWDVDGIFHGKSPYKMDDFSGSTPMTNRKPPYILYIHIIYIYIYLTMVHVSSIQIHLIKAPSTDLQLTCWERQGVLGQWIWESCENSVTFRGPFCGDVPRVSLDDTHNVRPPSYVCWLTKAPVTIVISTINHSYWSYKPT